MNLRKVERVTAQYESGIKLRGLSQDEIDSIKRELTFNNPTYLSVQKYSRYAYTNVPPYLTYYSEGKDYLEVPIGYDISRFNAVTKDNRVFYNTKTPPFVLELRDSQVEASEAYLKMNASYALNGCVQMNTGKGKSILALYLASVLSTRTLIVVHKDDLVVGWKKDIELAFGGKVKSGLIKAKSRTLGDFITIATVQTLNRLDPEDLDKLYSYFGFVVQDEQHHCPSTSFSLVSNFRARYKLGLTATPERSDGLTHVLHLYFGGFCYQYEYDEDDQDILPVKVKVVRNNLYFNPLCEKITIRDKASYRIVDLLYPEWSPLSNDQKRLSEVPYNIRPKVPFHTIDDFVVKGIIETVCQDVVREYNEGHSCVVFFTQKEHCRLYYDYLKDFIPEESMGLFYGDNPNNQEVLDKAESVRQFVTLTTYAKATEGTNVRQWEVEFLVSSINNEKNAEQASGRIRRVKEGKINPALLYDYRTPAVYSFSSHGNTRDKRYRALKFTFEGKNHGVMFSRGFR